jgi:NADPH:quinone reductase-like Zn-dependent oxidoreductase
MTGTGGVSLTALIFAKAAGATTIVTSSSDEKLAHVKKACDADHTINYVTHADWAAEAQRITNGEGVDHIIDVGGAGTIEQSLEAIAWGGVVSVIGVLKEAPKDQMPNVAFLTLIKGAVLRGILGASKEQIEEAVKFMAARRLKMPVYKTFGFGRSEVIEAFECIASGKHVGKVCISVI